MQCKFFKNGIRSILKQIVFSHIESYMKKKNSDCEIQEENINLYCFFEAQEYKIKNQLMY
jgi:hypothetical protein